MEFLRQPSGTLFKVEDNQQVTQHQSGTGSQSSSPPKTGKTLNTLHGELQSSLESGKLKSSMVAKGKGNLRGTGRGSLLYGGAQVVGAPGNMGRYQGDQNLSATPTYFPVMHLGGQQPGGTGVPAVGMAFPVYVAQPQFGLGNSDMTWLPVFDGTAGALGATYSSPHFAFDGAYHTRPAGGQISSLTAAPRAMLCAKALHELVQGRISYTAINIGCGYVYVFSNCGYFTKYPQYHFVSGGTSRQTTDLLPLGLKEIDILSLVVRQGKRHSRSNMLKTVCSKEDSTSKPDHGRKPQQNNELTNHKSGQRQKNSRRYTEMNFDQ